MKAALVLIVACCLAFASAVQPRLDEKLRADVQVLSYCSATLTNVCVASGASCTYTTSGTSYTWPFCPSGTYYSADRTSNLCVCTPYTYDSVTLGTNCSTADVVYNRQCKAKIPANGDTQTYWFSLKTQGDTCSGAFDCKPGLTCYNGKCYGRLLTGETCYNITSGISLTTSCSIKDYCPPSGDIRVCTARLAEGDDCTNATFASACPSYQSCLTSPADTSKKTCQTPRKYWIPAGQKANSSASDCYSNLLDYGNNTCWDYTEAYNLYKVKDGASCDSITDCPFFGDCECTSTSSSACYWPNQSHDELVASYATAIAKAKKYYDAGCDQSAESPLFSSTDFCQVALGYYTAEYSACNSAFAGRTVSVITIALGAIVAMLLSKW